MFPSLIFVGLHSCSAISYFLVPPTRACIYPCFTPDLCFYEHGSIFALGHFSCSLALAWRLPNLDLRHWYALIGACDVSVRSSYETTDPHAEEQRLGGPRGRMGLLEMLGLLLWIWGWLVMGDAVAVAVVVARKGLGFVSLASGYLVLRGLEDGTDAVVGVLLDDLLLEGQAVNERGCLRRGCWWRVDLGGGLCGLWVDWLGC